MDRPISAADLEEFRAIWCKEFGEELSLDRARAEAESLVSLIYDLRKLYQRSLRRQDNNKRRGSGFELRTNGMTPP